MRFEKDDGTFTVSDEENVEILSKHFHTVFNSNVKIDWSVLDELIQRKTYSSMNLPLSKSEFNKAIIHIVKILKISNQEGGYRVLSNIGINGGQEVPHFHYHIFGDEKIGKMVV